MNRMKILTENAAGNNELAECIRLSAWIVCFIVNSSCDLINHCQSKLTEFRSEKIFHLAETVKVVKIEISLSGQYFQSRE